jgi:hypothetical protein
MFVISFIGCPCVKDKEGKRANYWGDRERELTRGKDGVGTNDQDIFINT